MTTAPVTRSTLVRGMAALGVGPGRTVLAHASLSRFGYVAGGEHTVCLALEEVLGARGTLVMPGFSPQLVHPAAWRPARLNGADPVALADDMPSFDRASTPVAATIGVVAQCLRAMPGTRRSGHPHTSFLARGPEAEAIVADHPLEYRLSTLGPLGRLWALDAVVLLLGVSWSKCTALHIAEYLAPYPGRRQGRWPVPVAGPAGVRWVEVPELVVWEGDFERLGRAFEQARPESVRRRRIGDADCVAVSLRSLVRFAVRWLPAHRDLRGLADPPGWSAVEPATGVLPGA
ncbi:aminoglycoside N(3)-acetyltransferase [Streptomyces sp. NPDC056503]|uniref:aminoglycoside N(3)-acetyltransferase n=1 Tax=Streptomyces sp. NPDC056503 TaxID=3345842 RepID=UPI00367BE8AA